MNTPAARLRAFYKEVWETPDPAAVWRYFSTDARADGILPGQSIGPQEFEDLVTVLTARLGPIRIQVAHAVEQGDWLAALIRADTSRPWDGAAVQCHGQVMVRFDGDMMVETYNSFDFLALFEQMGQLPPDALAMCLGGQRLELRA